MPRAAVGVSLTDRFNPDGYAVAGSDPSRRWFGAFGVIRNNAKADKKIKNQALFSDALD
jgi:hypothetical protein